ncbi:TetR/AcrR family transcriptional regulator [Actinacidiphila acididurans]|uniref:TetR/AcrR family transcriptional regulator n=1 Tax=Actinacidiphila acididurans TaxID=2784346 RepID=A0ABS2TXQ8_9ACTN|nr:TetR/AcrR family transcriptional regulator [Actinacidiphila acididurans]MBM9507867.1 TetR/AcrR family transcriptional regulator [Actinacidiphila acididurans]
MSPRSPEANEELRAQSRERILAAALEVFAEKGYHDATISDITARAGVSRGLLTYYFPGKQNLVDELLDRYLDEVAAIIDVTGSPDERLAAIIDRIMIAAATTVPVQRMALSLVVNPATHPRFAAAEARKEHRVIALEDGLRDLFAARGAADPALEEVLLRSVLEGVVFKTAVYTDQYPVERIRRRLYELYSLPEPTADLLAPDAPEPSEPAEPPDPSEASESSTGPGPLEAPDGPDLPPVGRMRASRPPRA